MRPDSGRLVAVDAAAIVIASAAICLLSRQLLYMTVLIPVVFIARFIVLSILAKREGINLKAELLFLLICTVLGAFNDWNTV